ncbi:MAG: V-type ATP synthase subunit C [Bacillota bacterium]
MSEYLYATARIRALETQLIEENTVDRILNAPSVEDSVKILSETEYGVYFGELDNPAEFERAINNHLHDIYKVVEDATGNPDFTRLYKLKHDIHNLKVLLKARNTEAEEDLDILSPLGTMEIDLLKRAVLEQNFSDLPPFMKKAVQEAGEHFELNQEPQYINFILDKWLYDRLLEIADNLGEFAVEFVRTEIDLININTLLRFRKAEVTPSRFDDALVEGGFLSPSFFREYFNEPLDSFAGALMVTRYEDIMDLGLQEWLDNRQAHHLERALDNHFMSLARQGIYAASGLKPILGYLQAKDNEAGLLRLLLVGKINDISEENIRERLRDTYV